MAARPRREGMGYGRLPAVSCFRVSGLASLFNAKVQGGDHPFAFAIGFGTAADVPADLNVLEFLRFTGVMDLGGLVDPKDAVFFLADEGEGLGLLINGLDLAIEGHGFGPWGVGSGWGRAGGGICRGEALGAGNQGDGEQTRDE